MMAANSVLSMLKKVATKKVKIKAGEIEVKELTVNQVESFMQVAQELNNKESFENSKKTLSIVAQAGVVGLEETTEKDFDDMSLSNLKEIAEAVLKFNGLSVENTSEEDDNNPNV